MADDITKLGTNNTPDDENVSSSKFMEVLIHFLKIYIWHNISAS